MLMSNWSSDVCSSDRAGGALQRLVLVEDRTAHLQQPALVNAAHLIHPSWARRVATRLKKNAKGVPKILSTEIQRDERSSPCQRARSGIFLRSEERRVWKEWDCKG